jgi:hypothetical protein
MHSMVISHYPSMKGDALEYGIVKGFCTISSEIRKSFI